MNSWINTLLLSAGFLALFALAEFLYQNGKVKAEYTRKFVHLSSGILTLSFPLWLNHHLQVLFLCGSFAILLLLSKKYNFLRSVNAVDRNTHGSVLFPLSVYICFHLFLYYQSLLFFYAPMLVLAISDPLAALFGKRWPKGKYTIFTETKTLVGSLAFFLSALIILLAFGFYFIHPVNGSHLIVCTVLTALAATVSESVSTKGFDNLFIPLTVAAVLIVCLVIPGIV